MIGALTGTHGAGKEETAKFFQQCGFKHFNARKHVLEPAATARGRQIDRDGLNQTASELRLQHGPSYVAFRLFELAQEYGHSAIVESVYNEPEITRMRATAAAANTPFFLLAIDADIRTRYDRIKTRMSATDFLTFEQFCAKQEREMVNEDPNKHNLLACQRLADAPVIMNNGTLEQFHEALRATCITYLGFPALL